MKMQLTNALVKGIVRDVRNGRFKYAVGGILDNIAIFTLNSGSMMVKAEVNSDFTNYLHQIKQPESDFTVMNNLLCSMSSNIVYEFNFSEFTTEKHGGKEYLVVNTGNNTYWFDPKLFTKFHNSKKFEFRLWLSNSMHGIIVDEYVYEDDMFEHCALIMGVRKI